MQYLKFFLAGLLMITLTACESGRDKELLGTLLGAAAGAAIGSQIGSGGGQAAAIAVGALAGGVVGNLIGRELDERDRERAQLAARQSITTTQTGTSSSWVNPDTGNSGSYTPTSETFANNEGLNCRQVRQTIVIEGREQTDNITICENPDGTVVTS